MKEMWTIFRDLWDNVKPLNIRIIGVPEEEGKKKDHEKILANDMTDEGLTSKRYE